MTIATEIIIVKKLTSHHCACAIHCISNSKWKKKTCAIYCISKVLIVNDKKEAKNVSVRNVTIESMSPQNKHFSL